MTEQLGAQSAATCNVAIAIEQYSGVPESAPDAYIVMGGDISPVQKKPMVSKDIAGSMFPSLGYKGIETWEMPFPMLPVLEDASSPVRRNGLGELLLALFGADDCDALIADHAYEHTFSWETLIKTFTTWLHYDVNLNDKIRMCAIDSLALKIKADGELTLDFKAMGADLWTVLDADYGTQAQADVATAKQITGLGTRLEFGEPGANVRNSWEEINVDLKRNLDYGAPGKAGQHPAGSGSPQIVSSAKSNIELGITLRDRDRAEIMRGFAGGNVAPTATRMSDLYSLVKARLSIYGPALYAGINGEADYCNASALTAIFAGTYSGGETVTVWEIKIAQGTPDTYSFRKTTGAGWSAWSSPAPITAGPDALSDGVTVTFSSTTAGVEGDRFYCCSHYRYMLRMTFPDMNYQDAVNAKFSGGIRKADIKLYHPNTANNPTLDLHDSRATAYS